MLLKLTEGIDDVPIRHADWAPTSGADKINNHRQVMKRLGELGVEWDGSVTTQVRMWARAASRPLPSWHVAGLAVVGFCRRRVLPSSAPPSHPFPSVSLPVLRARARRCSRGTLKWYGR